MKIIRFKSLIDLAKQFPDEKSCHLYLAQQRWNTGEIICPHCSNNTCYVFKDQIRYKCKKCSLQFTAKTNTFMGGSKLATIKWLMSMYLVMHKKGISSHQLSKDLHVTQKTAWFMLHRLRGALGNVGAQQNMAGTVEIDETFVGGKNKNRHYSKRMEYKEKTGRSYPDKTTVFGLYERETGQVRAMVLSRQEFKQIGRAITYNVEPGATLMTDDWIGYKAVDKIYDRKMIDHGKWIYADGDVTTNRMENFWSHLKRGLHGTYIRVTPRHLNKYVQEFVFRFNHRKFDTQAQIESLIANMEIRLTYKTLTAA